MCYAYAHGKANNLQGLAEDSRSLCSQVHVVAYLYVMLGDVMCCMSLVLLLLVVHS